MKKEVKGMRILRCENCKAETPHDLTEIGFYLTALEVPLAPYKKKHVLMCRKCSLGEEVTKGEFKDLLTHSEGSGNKKPSEIRAEIRASKSGTPGKTSKRFCRQCGAKLRLDSKFCNECGKPNL